MKTDLLLEHSYGIYLPEELDFSKIQEATIFSGPLLEKYRVITTDGLKKLIDSGERFHLVDVLERESYEDKHICGAINIPVSDIEIKARDIIAKDDLVVVYSCNVDCTASAVGADLLTTLGFTDVVRYKGGVDEWKKAGHCIEGAGTAPEKRHPHKAAA